MDRVLFDVWGYRGFLVPEQYAGRRVGWTDTWYRSAPGSNPYANPVNGLHCVVDLNTMELLEIEDTFSSTSRTRWASTSRATCRT